ncbi:hypothetical protein [Roseivirga sp.]|uniref:hypothetical protein n=1 Tax=Roseivirga sp. TaxID=1964215 RepID=UPI003B8C5303
MKNKIVKVFFVAIVFSAGFYSEVDGMFFIPPNCYSTKVPDEGGMQECKLKGGCQWIDDFQPSEFDEGRVCAITF